MKASTTGILKDRAARSTLNLGFILTAGFGGLALVATSVFATLTASTSNVSAQSFATDTLKLVQTSSTVSGLTGGITTAISNMAPGDVVNRFIDLTNSGTMDGTSLKLQIADSANTILTTDAIKGLQVAITECSVAWTSVTGTCSGTSTNVLVSTSATSLAAAPVALSPTTLVAGSVNHLRIAITLPTNNEVTINGILPSGTVQGLTSLITWTFTESQRLATVTQS